MNLNINYMVLKEGFKSETKNDRRTISRLIKK